MKLEATYVLTRTETDDWGRTRRKFFQCIGRLPGQYHTTGRLRLANHYHAEHIANAERLRLNDPEAFEVEHIPVVLYPFELEFGNESAD